MNKKELTEVIASRIESGAIETDLDAEDLAGFVIELREWNGNGYVGTWDLYAMMKDNYIDSSEYGVDEWNEYCEDVGYTDDMVYYNDEYTINDMFRTPYDALTGINGEYDSNAEYFQMTIWGLETRDDIDDLLVDDDFKEWLIDNEKTGCYEVEQIVENQDVIVELCNEFEVIDD